MTTRGRVVVIGSGAAGLNASRSLVAAGWDVTVVERSRVGGTCLWYGCMPKKALYNSARYLRGASRAEMFGLTGEPGFDWQTVLAWKWHAQETYAGDQEAGLIDRGIRYVAGDARFVSPDEIEVDLTDPAEDGAETERIGFDHAVVATGSAPVMPPMEGIELADTSTDALSYPAPPESLLIAGGGFIGLEFAAIYASFGSKVTVVSLAPRILEMLDEEIAAVAVRRLERLGVEFRTSCKLTALAGEPGAVEATVTDADGGTLAGVYERVLMAVGRRPALDSLDLAAAGVQLDGKGAPVLDEALCSTNPRIWFAGDASGGMMQTPAASHMGRAVAASIESGVPVAADTSSIPTCLFTTPQVAQVGLTEVEARSRGIDVEIGSVTLEYSAAGVIEDERDGLIKLVFSAEDGLLLGAHIAAPGASDLVYSLAVAMRCGATRETLRETVGIHPAYCEMIPRAAS